MTYAVAAALLYLIPKFLRVKIQVRHQTFGEHNVSGAKVLRHNAGVIVDYLARIHQSRRVEDVLYTFQQLVKLAAVLSLYKGRPQKTVGVLTADCAAYRPGSFENPATDTARPQRHHRRRRTVPGRIPRLRRPALPVVRLLRQRHRQR